MGWGYGSLYKVPNVHVWEPELRFHRTFLKPEVAMHICYPSFRDEAPKPASVAYGWAARQWESQSPTIKWRSSRAAPLNPDYLNLICPWKVDGKNLFSRVVFRPPMCILCCALTQTLSVLGSWVHLGELCLDWMDRWEAAASFLCLHPALSGEHSHCRVVSFQMIPVLRTHKEGTLCNNWVSAVATEEKCVN